MAYKVYHGDYTFKDEKIEEIAKSIEVVNKKKAFWGDFCTNDTMTGDKLICRRQILIDPSAVATLAEGGTPTAKQLKVVTFEIETKSFGDYIEYTREAFLKNRDNLPEMARAQLSHNRLYDLEALRSSAFLGATNTIAKGSSDTWADLFDNASVRLFKNGGKRNGSSYVAIVTPEIAKLIKKEALASGNGLFGTDKGAEAAQKGYVGTYAEFEIYKCADSCMYPDASSGSTKDQVVLFVAKTDDGKWPVVARNATEGNIEVISHEIGSAGANDPLNQKGTIGARVDDVAAVLEREELVLKCSVSGLTMVSADIPGDYATVHNAEGTAISNSAVVTGNH